MLPAAWAVWKPSRTAAHLSAAGAMVSVWWLLAPFAPQDAALVLASGSTVDGLTFNGQSPGPQLRVKQGRLVEVTLVNTPNSGAGGPVSSR